MDDHYFMAIFMLKVGKFIENLDLAVRLTELKNKVKNINILRNMINICQFKININDVLCNSFHLICCTQIFFSSKFRQFRQGKVSLFVAVVPSPVKLSTGKKASSE